MTGHSCRNGLSFRRRDCRFGGGAVARLAGNEGRLRGGSDPRTNYVWCAGAPSCIAAAMLSPSLLEGIVFRSRQLFQRRRGGGMTGGQRLWGGQWPPIQAACHFQDAWRSPIYKVVGTTRELYLVALNCDHMVDKG